MSPGLLRILRAIERSTRRLANRPADRATFDTARYPRDYYRPTDLLRVRGSGA